MLTIDQIYGFDENTAAATAIDATHIKEHNIYFINLPERWGFSVLVYYAGHQIKYAADFALHHPGKTATELRKYYEASLYNKLFTEQEIESPLTSYDEYKRKLYFLQSYYSYRRNNISMFRIIHNAQEEKEFADEVAGCIRNPVALAFYFPEDQAFVDHHIQLYRRLQEERRKMEADADYLKSAFLYEMHNHEYGINWQGDYDVLSCFGNIHYCGEQPGELQAYFDQLKFNGTQRAAYFAARKQYIKETDG